MSHDDSVMADKPGPVGRDVITIQHYLDDTSSDERKVEQNSRPRKRTRDRLSVRNQEVGKGIGRGRYVTLLLDSPTESVGARTTVYSIMSPCNFVLIIITI